MILATVLIGYLISLPLAGQSAPLSIGSEKQLFLDQRLIQSSRNVELVLNPPEQPRENLILKDRPWEQGRAGGYAHVLRDGELYRMYYNSFDRSYRIRYFCLALSHDGVHWTKPNLGLIPYAGNFDTNIIGLDVFGSPFIDLFDTPDRRYKLYTRVGRARGSATTSSRGRRPAGILSPGRRPRTRIRKRCISCIPGTASTGSGIRNR